MLTKRSSRLLRAYFQEWKYIFFSMSVRSWEEQEHVQWEQNEGVKKSKNRDGKLYIPFTQVHNNTFPKGAENNHTRMKWFKKQIGSYVILKAFFTR